MKISKKFDISVGAQIVTVTPGVLNSFSSDILKSMIYDIFKGYRKKWFENLFVHFLCVGVVFFAICKKLTLYLKHFFSLFVGVV